MDFASKTNLVLRKSCPPMNHRERTSKVKMSLAQEVVGYPPLVFVVVAFEDFADLFVVVLAVMNSVVVVVAAVVAGAVLDVVYFA